MPFAIYNGYGDVTRIVGRLPVSGLGKTVEVPAGTVPDAIWVDPRTGEMVERQDYCADWGDQIDWTTGLMVPSLDGCALLAARQKLQPGTTFIPDRPGPVHIEMRGRFRFSKIITFTDYAESRRRAYPSIEEQLDMLFHDPEAWHAAIAAVKARFPKEG